MKKLFFLSLSLVLISFYSCFQNPNEDVSPKLNATEANDLASNENQVSDRSIPCEFQYQYTATSGVNICGDFAPGCDGSSCNVCSVGKTGHSLPAPSGSSLWINQGNYSVTNPGGSSVTFKIKAMTSSTWKTYTIPAGGEVQFRFAKVNNVYVVLDEWLC